MGELQAPTWVVLLVLPSVGESSGGEASAFATDAWSEMPSERASDGLSAPPSAVVMAAAWGAAQVLTRACASWQSSVVR